MSKKVDIGSNLDAKNVLYLLTSGTGASVLELGLEW